MTPDELEDRLLDFAARVGVVVEARRRRGSAAT